MNHFRDANSPILLCEQLLDLLNTMQNWVEKGIKGPKEIPFKFYVSETDLGNTFILLKRTERRNCLVRLFTINALNISDEHFCQEIETWLRSSAQQATLVSGASEKERVRFFNAQRKKINELIDKITMN